MIRVAIIGSGGVAEALAQNISHIQGAKIIQIYGRNTQRVESVAHKYALPHSTTKLDPTAQIYIIAVSDRAIPEVSSQLNLPADAIVVHTAGSVDIDAISHPRRGVLYALQSFSPNRDIDTQNTPFFVEGCDESTTTNIESLARLLSTNVKRMNSTARKEVHLCGVFASNFVNAIYAASAEIAHEANIPFDSLKPLIRECCDKALEVDDPRKVQTGPASRGDLQTQDSHIRMLESRGADNTDLIEIYKILSKRIWETSKKM